MAKLVVDASITASWCFPDERSDYTNAVLQAVGGTIDPVAPALWAYEVRNIVLVGLRRGRISQADAQKFFVLLDELNVQLVEPVSYERVFDLAMAHGLTVYDAAYLDLALRASLPLVSLDNALCRAAKSAGVSLFEPSQSN